MKSRSSGSTHTQEHRPLRTIKLAAPHFKVDEEILKSSYIEKEVRVNMLLHLKFILSVICYELVPFTIMFTIHSLESSLVCGNHQ